MVPPDSLAHMHKCPSQEPVDPAPAAVAHIAAVWNCACRGKCGGVQAAQCLYRATVDLAGSRDEDLAAQAAMRPLAVVVSRQKTRAGQDICRRYARALAAADHAAALAMCHSLIDMETERAAPTA